MTYEEAKEIYDRINGIERIPSFIMRIIVEHNQKLSPPKSPGISLDVISKKHLDRLIQNGFQIYEYLDNREYINYEGLNEGDLVAVKFNGVNFLTYNISEYNKLRKPEKTDWKANINAHPPSHFHKRYKLVKIN